MPTKLMNTEKIKPRPPRPPSVWKTLERLYPKKILYLALKNSICYGCIICLGFACSLDDGSEDIIIKQERYELFFSHSPEADLYMRKHLIDYFQSIALVTEYGNSLPILKKWTQPMSIYVSGQLEPVLMTELEEIIAELNPLFTDGFRMEIVTDSLLANYHIFLGDKATYSKMYPSTAHLLRENEGLFTYYLNDDYSIESGHMFVEVQELSLRFQKHILREELTQSLGLPNDIDIYVNSIFYKKWSDVQAYSQLDIEVIRLLYHPKMIPNLGLGSVRSTLENILGI